MIKTVLKVNGMMCGMCEAHMNDLVRKNFNVKKVTSSVKGGETVVISEENLDIPFLKKEIKEIGYELVDVHTEPYEKKSREKVNSITKSKSQIIKENLCTLLLIDKKVSSVR